VAKRGNKRGSGDQFVKLPNVMARHPAFRSLSGAAVKVWIELNTHFMGTNNGKLYLSLNDAADLLLLSKGTAKRAFDELEAKGFIRKTQAGQFRGHWAAEWAVTHQKLKEEPASRAWQSFVPSAQQFRRIKERKEREQKRKKKLGTQVDPNAPHGSTTVPLEEAPGP